MAAPYIFRIRPIAIRAGRWFGAGVLASPRRRLLLGALALVIAVGITPAGSSLGAGTVVHVSPSGNDANAGTEAAPVRTVRRGLLLLLRPGSTLFVHGGTYDEVVRVADLTGTAAAPILIRNAPGETPTIRGRFQIDRPSYVTVQGLRLTRAVTPTDEDRASSVLTMNGGTHWELRDNEVFDTVGYAALAVGGDATNYRVVGNCFHDVGATHPFGQDHGMYIVTTAASGPGYVERNIVYNTLNGTAMKIGKAPDTGHPAGLSPNLMTVRNNTFYRDIVNVRVVWGTTHLRMTRNAMVAATWSQEGRGRLTVQGYCNWGTDVTMTDNLVWDSDVALDHFHGGSCTPTKPWTTISQSGSVRFNPVLRAPTSCAGFQNAEPAAASYGRYAPVDQVLAGRFAGGAAQAPVVANGSTVAERSSASGGASADVRTEAFEYGTGGDLYVAGDWNGDGVDGIGVYRPSATKWYLRNGNGAGDADHTITWGLTAAQPLTGDFNGDGHTDIGVVRGGVVFLKYFPFAGDTHDVAYNLGTTGDRYVAGDWNGDGVATVGYVHGTTWHLRDCNAVTCPETVFNYGAAGDRYTAGDWNGDGVTTPAAITRENQWQLRNTNTAGPPETTFRFDG
jgi:hypothetical protein